MADMGHDAVTDVMTTLRGSLIGARIARKADLSEVIESALRNSLLSLLEAGYWDFDKTVKSFASQGTPVSIMMVGVNGTGKTTTTAKITNRLTNQGYSVVLAAADTFRAGAIDQLANHADKLGLRCIRSQRGGDAAAVASCRALAFLSCFISRSPVASKYLRMLMANSTDTSVLMATMV